VRDLRDALVPHLAAPEHRALCLLAVEEAVVNVFEHGYGGRPGCPLLVAVRSLPKGSVEVVLRDRAPVFDPGRVPVQDLRELARRETSRGRGLPLMRLLAGSIGHRPRRGGGNELVLVFEPARLARVIQEHVFERT
jgi:anti-sigma regulatory factor (Ser/Thr protein kinase)